MPNANELTLNTSASAMDMANAMFGNGITIQSATYTGAALPFVAEHSELEAL